MAKLRKIETSKEEFQIDCMQCKYKENGAGVTEQIKLAVYDHFKTTGHVEFDVSYGFRMELVKTKSRPT